MQPLTYQRIEDNLRKLINRERELVREFAESTEDYANAEVAFKQRYAKERVLARDHFRHLGVRFNEGMVEDDAQIAAEHEFREYTIAKTGREALKTSIASVRAQMDAMRSLMSSHRQMADVEV